MFWRILKKDLKRKKTMNIILLLFVILCTMFAAASVNNIAAVTGGIEQFFKMADVPDITVSGVTKDNGYAEKIRALSGVTKVNLEHSIIIPSSKSFKYDGKQMTNFINPAELLTDSEMYVHSFDSNNERIDAVEQGSFYCTAGFMQKMDIQPGETVTLDTDGVTIPLTFKGIFKNPVCPYVDSNSPYLLLNHADYDKAASVMAGSETTGMFPSSRLFVKTSDVKAVQELVDKDTTLGCMTAEDWKGGYTYDMFAAYIMLAISIALMATAFAVLRFAIGFSISGEYREIGVMKAVGIGNTSIRGLYFAKYLAIAVAGAALGFLTSMPVGKVMMDTVSNNIVLNSGNDVIYGLIGSAGVVAILLGFSYLCTRSIKRLSPIDAVRCGQTGERFKKRSLMHLGKSKLGATGFLSVNDVASSPKRFGIITVVFAMCMLVMTMMSNFAETLKSDKILWLFNVPDSEAHILDTEVIKGVMSEPESYQVTLDDVHKTLDECGMDADVTITMGVSSETMHAGQTAKLDYNVTKGDVTGEPRMDSGSAPKKTDEVTMTNTAMEKLNASIGDRITTNISGKEYEFIITGTVSSFDANLVRLHPDFEIGNQTLTNMCGVQLHFHGSPDQAQIEQNINILRDKYNTDKVYNTSTLIDTTTQMSGTMQAIYRLMILLTVVLVLMIVILMERSFITKEKSELALMKAVGINNGSIISQHVLRFLIVAVIACGISFAAMMPASNAIMNWVCCSIGDVSGIRCAINPVEIFAVCPTVLIGVTVIGALLTALYTKTVKASDTASIE